MSSRIKRKAKEAALELVAARSSARPDAMSWGALRMMKIKLEAGLSTGYEGGAKAACCMSVDFDVTKDERFLWNHEGTRALVSLSERHGIPITWAICGKTAEEDHKAYESILSASVEQEIAVHTYSHIYADAESAEFYEEDIGRCVQVLGLASPPKTFIFPKNREGHFGVLRKMGFTAYRGAQRAMGSPRMKEGLWNIRPVYYVDGKSLGAVPLVRRFIDACISRGAVFHLWTHPWSLAIEGKVNAMKDDFMEPVFQYIEDKKSQGLISLTTMGDLADFLLANQSAQG